MIDKYDPMGTHYLFRAIPMLFRPGLRAYVIAPILASVLLFSLLLWGAIEGFQYVVDWVNAYIPSWLSWLNWLFWLLFALSFLVFFMFTFTLLSCLVAAPFNGLLAEKVETMLTNQAPQDTSIAVLIKDIPRVMLREVQKLVYFIPRALLLLLLFLIPGINLIAPVLWLLFSAWIMAIQYVDYPMDNHRVPFKKMKQILGKNRGKSLGFGGSVMLFMLIPGVNLLILPAAVVAATMMYVDLSNNQRG